MLINLFPTDLSAHNSFRPRPPFRGSSVRTRTLSPLWRHCGSFSRRLLLFPTQPEGCAWGPSSGATLATADDGVSVAIDLPGCVQDAGHIGWRMRREESPKPTGLFPPPFQRKCPRQRHALARMDVRRIREGARIGDADIALRNTPPRLVGR